MNATDIDYLWDFQDAVSIGPDIPLPVFPLPCDTTDVGDLKNFMMNAGSHGILPTRAVISAFTLRHIQPSPENDINCKQIESIPSPTPDTILDTALISRGLDLKGSTL